MRYVDELVETLGMAGVLGLGVLAFCAAFHFGAVKPAERELAAQQRAAELLRARSPHQQVSQEPRADTLQRFYQLFPPVAQLTDEVETLHTLARKAGLDLQQGEYRLDDRGFGLAAYHVTLPLRGSYGQIRQFVGAILAEMPIVSLDALRFERTRIDETQLDAQLRLTIHLRSGAGRAPG
jgi:hypothetical protein